MWLHDLSDQRLNITRKNKWVRELSIRFAFHQCQFPYNRVALSLWPRRAHLPPCSSFSHRFRAAAERHVLWSPPWERCSSLHCWWRGPREISPSPKKLDDCTPL